MSDVYCRLRGQLATSGVILQDMAERWLQIQSYNMSHCRTSILDSQTFTYPTGERACKSCRNSNYVHVLQQLADRLAATDITGWQLVITGHSLGAGAAALVALYAHNFFPR